MSIRLESYFSKRKTGFLKAKLLEYKFELDSIPPLKKKIKYKVKIIKYKVKIKLFKNSESLPIRSPIGNS